MAWVDRGRLERVIGNLLCSVLRGGPTGQGISLSLSSEEGCAVLRVRCPGLELEAEDLPHFFELFYRPRNTRRRHPGDGVVLASARHVVKQHGGTIGVDVPPEGGACFTLRLPLPGPSPIPLPEVP